jgi:putative DNA primase/helicase
LTAISFKTELAHSPGTIARALGGTRQGAGWTARCPAHDDRAPSLSVSAADNGKILVHCHAGCEQRQVVAALKARGLWAEPPRTFRPPSPVKFRQITKTEQGERHKGALAIWGAARPAAGTLVETYLAARGIRSPETKALRFHAGLKHPSGGVWPAMVALVTHGAEGTPVAVHRTFLARDGLGKAPIDPAKMMLGPCRGGVVRLSRADEMMVVGEGIETVLSAMQLWGLAGLAALSANGLAALDVNILPDEVVVAADHDPAGLRAAADLQQRLIAKGKTARVFVPHSGFNDFNDILRSRLSGSVG